MRVFYIKVNLHAGSSSKGQLIIRAFSVKVNLLWGHFICRSTTMRVFDVQGPLTMRVFFFCLSRSLQRKTTALLKTKHMAWSSSPCNQFRKVSAMSPSSILAISKMVKLNYKIKYKIYSITTSPQVFKLIGTIILNNYSSSADRIKNS
jgi:hypothetical protein